MKIGDTVVLRPSVLRTSVPEGREDNRSAKIKALLPDVAGGVYLARDLNGCRYWNVSELRRIRKSC